MKTKPLTNEELAELVPPWKAPKLADLARACNNGACNVTGLNRSFTEAVIEIPHGQAPNHPAYKIILGQLTFLVGESLGPSLEALNDFERWDKQPKP